MTDREEGEWEELGSNRHTTTWRNSLLSCLNYQYHLCCSRWRKRDTFVAHLSVNIKIISHFVNTLLSRLDRCCNFKFIRSLIRPNEESIMRNGLLTWNITTLSWTLINLRFSILHQDILLRILFSYFHPLTKGDKRCMTGCLSSRWQSDLFRINNSSLPLSFHILPFSLSLQFLIQHTSVFYIEKCVLGKKRIGFIVVVRILLWFSYANLSKKVLRMDDGVNRWR